jgi:uncharacterized protein
MRALSFYDVCASLETIAEMEVVLDRSKFDRYLDREKRQAFAANVRRRVHLFEVQGVDLTEVALACRDPSDNMFLALALAAEAEAIVSSDDDLLVLHPWREIQILTPAGFVSMSTGEHLRHPV